MAPSAVAPNADIILNRVNLALAKTERLLASWLPPTPNNVAGPSASRGSESGMLKHGQGVEEEDGDDGLFTAEPELLGLGAKPSSSANKPSASSLATDKLRKHILGRGQKVEHKGKYARTELHTQAQSQPLAAKSEPGHKTLSITGSSLRTTNGDALSLKRSRTQMGDATGDEDDEVGEESRTKVSRKALAQPRALQDFSDMYGKKRRKRERREEKRRHTSEGLVQAGPEIDAGLSTEKDPMNITISSTTGPSAAVNDTVIPNSKSHEIGHTSISVHSDVRAKHQGEESNTATKEDSNGHNTKSEQNPALGLSPTIPPTYHSLPQSYSALQKVRETQASDSPKNSNPPVPVDGNDTSQISQSENVSPSVSPTQPGVQPDLNSSKQSRHNKKRKDKENEKRRQKKKQQQRSKKRKNRTTNEV